MTGEPFRILTQGSAAAVAGEAASETDGGDGDDRPRSRPSDRAGRDPFGVAGSSLGGRAGSVAPGPFSETLGGDDEELGGIVGVVSRSTEESLIEYNGATRYDQWLFVHQAQAITPGAAGAAAPFPGGMGSGPAGSAGVGRAAGSLDGGLFQRPGGDFGERTGRGRGQGRPRGR